MKQVAHRVDEHHSRCTPTERITQPMRTKRKVETAFEWVPSDVSEALGEPLRIAVIATATHFCATCYGVPRGIRPFN